MTTCRSSIRLLVFLMAHVVTTLCEGPGVGSVQSVLLSKYLRHTSFVFAITVCISFRGSYAEKRNDAA